MTASPPRSVRLLRMWTRVHQPIPIRRAAAEERPCSTVCAVIAATVQ
jgi:hypothetical protein